jgi:hypothetical protein
MSGQLQRTNPLVTLAFAAIGLAGGLVVQFARSALSRAPFAPPYSLAATMVVLAGVLLVLAIMIRRRIIGRTPGGVNPFHAVRVLAAARASQFVAALIGGFGGGLVLSLVGRTVAPAAALWLPMAATFIAGLSLMTCGIIAEYLCRVPPESGDEAGTHGQAEGGIDQPA